MRHQSIEAKTVVPPDDRDQVVGRIGDWLVAGGHVLLMTDYDGTLTPLVDDPAEAWLSDEVRRDLRTLAHSSRCRIALISGRGLEDLRSRAPLAGVVYAGCHGLEIVGPDFSFCHPEAESQRAALEAISRALIACAPGIEGMRVEPKRLAVAIHYRHVPPALRPALKAEVTRAIRHQHARLRISHGLQVIEVLPQVTWNKGTCAIWIRTWARRKLRAPMLTVYLGDDWTDEDAFEALAGLGLTVRVGGRPSTSLAAHWLNGVGSVHQLLAAMASIVAAEEHA